MYNNKTIVNNEEENHKCNMGNGGTLHCRVLPICL